jgi:hypothetical protein
MFLKHWAAWFYNAPGRLARWYRRKYASQRAYLNDYEDKVFSQNGEDGIIAEIVRRLGIAEGFFVEFGVQSGRECNTARLVQIDNWSGVVIEGADEFQQLLADRFEGRAVRVVHAFITAENIASLFTEAGVPKEFDLLSIDIDGNDFWVWRALRDYKPRVVVIEYNADHKPPKQWVMKYDPHHTWDGTTYYGASLTSLATLGNDLGYALLGTDSLGVNAFFVRRDLVARVGFAEPPVERAFHPVGFLGSTGKIGHPRRDGESVMPFTDSQ